MINHGGRSSNFTCVSWIAPLQSAHSPSVPARGVEFCRDCSDGPVGQNHYKPWRFYMRLPVLAALFFVAIPGTVRGQSMEADQVPISFILGLNPHTSGADIPAGSGSVLGIDSLPNWSSYFYYPGLDFSGFPQFTWQYTMVGNAPFSQGHDDDWRGETT